MKDEIQYTVEWTIKPGKLDTFKELADQAIGRVKKNEPGMKGYQWYFNGDKTKCYTAEWHTSSDSLLAHLQNVGDLIPELLGQSDITRFEVFGNPNDQAKDALSSLGVKVYNYYDGFTR